LNDVAAESAELHASALVLLAVLVHRPILALDGVGRRATCAKPTHRD